MVKAFASAPVKLNVADLKLQRGNTSNPPPAKPRPSVPSGKARDRMFGSDSFDLDGYADDDVRPLDFQRVGGCEGGGMLLAIFRRAVGSSVLSVGK